jgi:hypothetical protein
MDADERRLARMAFAAIGLFQGLVFWAVVNGWPEQVAATRGRHDC